MLNLVNLAILYGKRLLWNELETQRISSVDSKVRTNLQDFHSGSEGLMLGNLLRLLYLYISLDLQSRQVKCTSKIPLKNWLFEKVSLVVVPVTTVVSNSNWHSCMRNEMWIFYENFSVSGQRIINSLMEPWRVRLTWLECNGARVRYFCAFSTLTQMVTELTEISYSSLKL